MNEKILKNEVDILNSLIEMFEETQRIAKNNLIKFIQNKGIPLDTRWEMYLKHGSKILPVDSYYYHPEGIDWNKHTLYDDFYCEMYETMTVDHMTDILDGADDIKVDWNLYKESWMGKAIWGFINDW